MPINGFSTGRDMSLNFNTPSGPLTVSLVTKHSAKRKTADHPIIGMDGIVRPISFPQGWEGTIEVERQDSSIEDYFLQLDANYYAGLNSTPATITETITEVSGAISQYQYIGVVLKLEDAGDWEGDKSVKLKLSFLAQDKLKML